MTVRFMMIEAEGESASATIDAALAIFSGKRAVSPTVPDLPADVPSSIALPAPSRPRKPRKSKAERPDKAARHKAASAHVVNGGGQPVAANGVTVNLTAGEESIEHDGKTIEVTDRQARLFAALAAGAPQPIDRAFLIKKVWARPADAQTFALLSQLAISCAQAAAAVGLVIKSIRNVGIQLCKSAE